MGAVFVAYDHTGSVIARSSDMGALLETARAAVKDGRSKLVDVRRADADPPEARDGPISFGMQGEIDVGYAETVAKKRREEQDT